jgi:hypothetical protein
MKNSNYHSRHLGVIAGEISQSIWAVIVAYNSNRKQLKTSFERFFLVTGICETSFQWDEDYFPSLNANEAKEKAMNEAMRRQQEAEEE